MLPVLSNMPEDAAILDCEAEAGNAENQSWIVSIRIEMRCRGLLHIVLIVLISCSSGAKLGATTAKPTITPSWTPLAARSDVELAALSVQSRGLHTEDAVGHEANIVKADE